MTQEQADRIEQKLDRLLSIFDGKSPGEVRRKAKSDVLRYLQKHSTSVIEGHGGADNVKR